jgi:hypothetical protein
VTDPADGDFSSSVLTSLPAGKYPIADSLLQLTNSQAGGHLTPTSSSTAVKVKIKVKVTVRLVVYSQSVRLSARPLETHDQNNFSIEPLRS